MANWNSSELQTPDAIKKIGQNAKNVMNNLDILLRIVKGGADVAKLFLLLSNPAGFDNIKNSLATSPVCLTILSSVSTLFIAFWAF